MQAQPVVEAAAPVRNLPARVVVTDYTSANLHLSEVRLLGGLLAVEAVEVIP
jgi:hypothetical protein